MAGEDGAQAGDLGSPAAAPVISEARTSGGSLAGGAAAPISAPVSAPVTAPVPVPSGRATLSREKAAAIDQIFDLLARAPHQFDFYQVMRRLESLYCDRPERPRFGAGARPADEPLRLAQEPSLAFALQPLAGLTPGKNGAPPRLAVNFFGLLGPNGPLPLHITEYTRERLRNAEDPTMSRFFDLFHHRMLLLFYRVWSTAQPTVGHDHPATNRFVTYIGALEGLGLPSLRERDDLPDAAKLFYTGRLAAQTHSADGLQAMIGDFFQMPTHVESFVGSWLEIPAPHQWRLGMRGARGGQLGMSTTAGQRTWGRQQKFRVILGPLNRGQFQRMLPGGTSLKKLTALVRNYTGDEFLWDARLILDEQTEEPCRLGRSRLGWTSWLGRPKHGRREDLILDPQAEAILAAA